MEILYVTAVLAIFALCIVLFSTARRVLHSTPLTNGDLSLVQVERLTQSWEPIAQRSFEESELSAERDEPEYAEDTLNLDDYLLPQPTALEEAQPEAFVAPAVQMPAPEPPKEMHVIAASEVPEIYLQPQTMFEPRVEPQPLAIRNDRLKIQPRAVREDTMETSSPRTSHYILECLLIGISVFVLVKTQKSTLQYRSERSSNRVA